jgi:hypothetical protein
MFLFSVSYGFQIDTFSRGDWAKLPSKFPSTLSLARIDPESIGWRAATENKSWLSCAIGPKGDSLTHLAYNLFAVGYDPWSRRFSIVPICSGSHIWLVIFDTRGFPPTQENALDPDKVPYIYVLDSLEAARPFGVMDELVKWVTYWQILIHKVNQPLPPKVFFPSVARQQDGCNCGLFTAYFIIIFSAAPEKFADAFQVSTLGR